MYLRTTRYSDVCYVCRKINEVDPL